MYKTNHFVAAPIFVRFNGESEEEMEGQKIERHKELWGWKYGKFLSYREKARKTRKDMEMEERKRKDKDIEK